MAPGSRLSIRYLIVSKAFSHFFADVTNPDRTTETSTAYDIDPGADNVITAPRLLLDVGKFFGEKGAVQVGVEYQIWRNKFGIRNIDEDVPQAMVKFIF